MNYLIPLAAMVMALLLAQCNSPVSDYSEHLVVHQCDVLESIMTNDWEQCCREQNWECN